MDKTRVYIATGKSRKIIRDAKIAEKKGYIMTEYYYQFLQSEINKY